MDGNEEKRGAKRKLEAQDARGGQAKKVKSYWERIVDFGITAVQYLGVKLFNCTIKAEETAESSNSNAVSGSNRKKKEKKGRRRSSTSGASHEPKNEFWKTQPRAKNGKFLKTSPAKAPSESNDTPAPMMMLMIDGVEIRRSGRKRKRKRFHNEEDSDGSLDVKPTKSASIKKKKSTPSAAAKAEPNHHNKRDSWKKQPRNKDGKFIPLQTPKAGGGHHSIDPALDDIEIHLSAEEESEDDNDLSKPISQLKKHRQSVPPTARKSQPNTARSREDIDNLKFYNGKIQEGKSMDGVVANGSSDPSKSGPGRPRKQPLSVVGRGKRLVKNPPESDVKIQEGKSMDGMVANGSSDPGRPRKHPLPMVGRGKRLVKTPPESDVTPPDKSEEKATARPKGSDDDENPNPKNGDHQEAHKTDAFAPDLTTGRWCLNPALEQQHPNSGNWSMDQKLLFYYATRQFGFGNWREICKFVPNRSRAQCKSRGQGLAQRKNPFRILHDNEEALRLLLARAYVEKGGSDSETEVEINTDGEEERINAEGGAEGADYCKKDQTKLE